MQSFRQNHHRHNGKMVKFTADGADQAQQTPIFRVVLVRMGPHTKNKLHLHINKIGLSWIMILSTYLGPWFFKILSPPFDLNKHPFLETIKIVLKVYWHFIELWILDLIWLWSTGMLLLRFWKPSYYKSRLKIFREYGGKHGWDARYFTDLWATRLHNKRVPWLIFILKDVGVADFEVNLEI